MSNTKPAKWSPMKYFAWAAAVMGTLALIALIRNQVFGIAEAQRQNAEALEKARQGFELIRLCVIAVVVLVVVVAWVWFPFMVSKKMDTMLSKMDELIRLQKRD